MKILINSDHHFLHNNIIKYVNSRRIFKDINSYSDEYIKFHNSVISNEDYWICLGDFCVCSEDDFNFDEKFNYLKNLMDNLNGNKILIKGNHDTLSNETYKKLGFLNIFEDIVFIQNFGFCHYPLYKKKEIKQSQLEKDLTLRMNNYIINNNIKDFVLFHGHVHNRETLNTENPDIKRVNVCVDYLKDTSDLNFVNYKDFNSFCLTY